MCIFRFILRPKKIGFGELSFRNYADLEYRTLSNYYWHANSIPWSVFSKAAGLRQTLRIRFLIEHLQWLFSLFRNEFHLNYFFVNTLKFHFYYRLYCAYTKIVLSNGITHTAWKVPKYGVISGPYFPAYRMRENTDTWTLFTQCHNTKLNTKLLNRYNPKLQKPDECFKFFLNVLLLWTVCCNWLY